LKDTMAQMFGLGRLTRRILGPAIDALVRDPLLWYVNKAYRPTLLGASAALQQLTRAKWSDAQVREELARQGYSDDRIAALLNEQRKFLATGDAYTLFRAGLLTTDAFSQNLRDQGFDAVTAAQVFTAHEHGTTIGIDDNTVAPAVRAFVDRRIDLPRL